MLLRSSAPVEVLQQLAERFGIEEPRWGVGEDTCILCGLCVRVCDEVVGAHALAFGERGIHRRITTPFDEVSADCILCGACAKVCPTGHITLEELADRAVVHRDMELGPNAAISIPFRQAVPNVPRIDPDACIHFTTDQCGVCSEVCPREAIHYDDEGSVEEHEVGAVVLATGFDNFDPTPLKQYGYGRYSNVITAEEFEVMNNASGPTGGKVVLENGEEPRSIAILHCIGSRDEDNHPYCSRVCCMYAFKFSHLVIEKTDAEIYQFYIDVRSYGKGYEEFYQRLLTEGVNLVRGKGAEVVPSTYAENEEGHLIVRCEDTLVGEYREVPVDMVVLCTALEARRDAKEVSRLFNVSTGADGWFIEAHPKLGPVSTTTDGVFIAGTCQGPKDIPDTVAQGGAAAAQALRLMSVGEVMLDAAYAVINEEQCGGCRICNDLCPYTAIDYDGEKKVSIINDALCKACGTCVAACPAGAIEGRHFTDEQIYAQIEGMLR
jgi:heterodisulfide reductase subunit A